MLSGTQGLKVCICIERQPNSVVHPAQHLVNKLLTVEHGHATVSLCTDLQKCSPRARAVKPSSSLHRLKAALEDTQWHPRTESLYVLQEDSQTP